MPISVLKGHIVSAPKLGKLEITENGYLVLDDGVIVGIYDALPERWQNAPIADYSGKLILQSFADMHMHAAQFPMLSIGLDLPLLDWLQRYAFPTEARFSDVGYAREVYAELAKKLLHYGTTRVVAFGSLHADATIVLMEELEKAGVTGYVGKVNMDRNAMPGVYGETTEDSMRDTIRFLDAAERFTKVKPIITPRFTPSCTNELMEFLGKIVRERGLRVQSHLSENRQEIAWVRELHPDCSEYWETYDKYGLFGDHTVMAHCVHSSAREREVMKQRNVLVAHCPDSNINICSGIVPVRTMLNEGLWVALGSDIAGGAELPMNRAITGAIRMSNARHIVSDWQDDFLTVEEAFYLGTTSGARYFGAGDGFAAGDALHAIVVDDEGLSSAKDLSVLERLKRALNLMDDRNIIAVYSEGRKVV